MAGSDGSGDGAGWRVFVSHTSELRDYPPGNSYVAAAERAISAEGHVIVDMADFPAADRPAARLCMDRVRSCRVYVGVLGTRYGSPVRDKPQVSYTELEFDTATEAGLDRLVFLLDTEAADVGLPVSALIDREFGARQDAFRQRVRDSGLVTGSFDSPAGLGQLVERSLRELAQAQRARWREPGRPGPGGRRGRGDPARAAGVPAARGPAGGAGRARPGVAGSGGACADRDAGGGQDSPGRGVCPGQAGCRAGGWWPGSTPKTRPECWRAWPRLAAALGLAAGAGDAVAAGRAVRHRLEADGERCLLVFDNATDPGLLRPFLPAAGAARVIITSNYQPVAYLGAGVSVDVFTEAEALTFLAARTGQADAAGARALAQELGCLPLALAQAAAVIASQHLSYGTYLDRLRRLPVADLLAAEEAGQYPRGVAAAVLLSLDTVRAGDQGGACAAVMDLVAVLSAAGVRRSLLHAAAREGLADRDGPVPALEPEVADRVLARLAGTSLLTFSLDGSGGERAPAGDAGDPGEPGRGRRPDRGLPGGCAAARRAG